jgi:Fe-S-cluster containining protein
MTEQDKMAHIEPVRLGINSTFRFACHKKVPCFTQCCRGIKITLTPYDIIRLKKRLDLPSDQFLAIYTEPQVLEKTDLPMVTLKMLDDDTESCPFVRDEEGCIIYEDRPTTCRYYPLGVATLQHKEGADDEGFFFMIQEPHCKGFEEDREWTVKAWREDQGVDLRDEVNAEWTDLLVRKRSFPASIKLTDQAKQMFFMVSYNLDKFREFVFESTFLERFEVDEKTKEEIREDDVALLKFGVTWLKGVLFKNAPPEEQAANYAGEANKK